jgi:MFS family permease
MGLGTFLFALLSQSVIAAAGWRMAFAVLGGLVLVVLVPLNLVFLRHKPGEMGLLPDGLTVQSQESTAPTWQVLDSAWAETHWTVGRLVRTPRFWTMIAFPFLVTTGTYIVLVHHVRFLIDMGIDPMLAAYVLAVVGIVSSGFRVFWGWFSDRVGREITYSLGVVTMVVGVLSLVFIEMTGEIRFVYLFVLCYGMGWGVTAPMFMSTAADLFQGRTFGLVYGIVEGVLGAGGALGAWIAGYLYDRTGTYQWAFGMAAATAAISCGLMWLAAPRKVRRIQWNTRSAMEVRR